MDSASQAKNKSPRLHLTFCVPTIIIMWKIITIKSLVFNLLWNAIYSCKDKAEFSNDLLLTYVPVYFCCCWNVSLKSSCEIQNWMMYLEGCEELELILSALILGRLYAGGLQKLCCFFLLEQWLTIKWWMENCRSDLLDRFCKQIGF